MKRENHVPYDVCIACMRASMAKDKYPILGDLLQNKCFLSLGLRGQGYLLST